MEILTSTETIMATIAGKGRGRSRGTQTSQKNE